MRGFTVFELLLVLIVIAITATASISAFFSRPDVTLDNAARLLVDDLLHAQSRAALMGSEVAVVFAPDGRGYQILCAATSDALDEDVRGRRYDTDAVFEGVRVRSVEFAGSDRISFNREGAALENGCIELGYRGDVRAVRVERGRGLVYIPDNPCDDLRSH